MDAAAHVLEDRLTRDEVATIRGQEESHGSLPASRRGTPRPYNKSRIRARSPPREETRRRLERLEQEYHVNARIEDLERRLRSASQPAKPYWSRHTRQIGRASCRER